MKHLGVHMNSFKRVHGFQIELEFGSAGFWGEGKTGVHGEKPVRARERTNNKLNPHTYMASTPGVKPGPPWCFGRWALSPLRHPLLPQIFNTNCSCAMLPICTFAKFLRKQPTFDDATSGLPAKWCPRNECRNSILMIHLYLDLGSASDWLKICFKQSDPLVSQIWVVTCHKYGISVLVPQMSLPNVGCFQAFRKCRGLEISYFRRETAVYIKIRCLGSADGSKSAINFGRKPAISIKVRC